MRKFYYLTPILVIAIASLTIYKSSVKEEVPQRMSKMERIQGAIDDYRMTSSDVDRGIIPYDKLFAAIDEGKSRLSSASTLIPCRAATVRIHGQVHVQRLMRAL